MFNFSFFGNNFLWESAKTSVTNWESASGVKFKFQNEMVHCERGHNHRFIYFLLSNENKLYLYAEKTGKLFHCGGENGLSPSLTIESVFGNAVLDENF